MGSVSAEDAMKQPLLIGDVVLIFRRIDTLVGKISYIEYNGDLTITLLENIIFSSQEELVVRPERVLLLMSNGVVISAGFDSSELKEFYRSNNG